MRGSDERWGSLFSYVDIESRVPAKHPLRTIKGIVARFARCRVRPPVRGDWAPVDRAGAPASRVAFIAAEARRRRIDAAASTLFSERDLHHPIHSILR